MKIMKKITLAIIALVAATGMSAQTFRPGDMVVDLGLGVGTADIVEISGSLDPLSIVSRKDNRATFTQKLAFEYGLMDYDGLGTIGVGLMINNAYGGGFNTITSGSYDYTYVQRAYRYGLNSHNRPVWNETNSRTIARKGVGTAKAHANINDFNFMIKASLHRQFIDRLDTYATIGFGVSAYKVSLSDFGETVGISSGESKLNRNDTDHTYQLDYYYNDLDHIKWESYETKARFAMALFVGARYYFTDNWAVNAEFGLNSISFHAHACNYNVLSFGASYKF